MHISSVSYGHLTLRYLVLLFTSRVPNRISHDNDATIVLQTLEDAVLSRFQEFAGSAEAYFVWSTASPALWAVSGLWASND